MKIRFAIFLILFLVSCSEEEEMADVLKGGWVVEQVELDGAKTKRTSVFQLNLLNFNEDGTCLLPAFHEYTGRNANWVLKKLTRTKYSVEFSNSQNDLMNRQFNLKVLETKPNIKIQLESKEINLVCVKSY